MSVVLIVTIKEMCNGDYIFAKSHIVSLQAVLQTHHILKTFLSDNQACDSSQ